MMKGLPEKITSFAGFVANRPALFILLAFLASWMFTMENLAELKFFGRGLIPFSGVPFALANALWGPEDYYMVLSCDQLSNRKLLLSTQNPVLFKKCVPNPHNLSVDKDFATFPNSSTNIFPSCGETIVARNFMYTPIEGDEINITEIIPCASSTLQEKIQFYHKHEPARSGPWFDVNVFALSVHDELVLEDDFKRKGILPPDFSFARLASIHFLAHFFASGTTAVNYYHSHQDRFFSFGIQSTKVWDLINPKYHDSFEYEWSGNAIVLTKEKKRVPHVVIEQEPGDVLFITPWWIHKTGYSDPSKTLETKNVNFNLHSMSKRSLTGIAVHIFMRWLGQMSWFYDSKKTRDAFKENGL